MAFKHTDKMFWKRNDVAKTETTTGQMMINNQHGTEN
jgi:hypothetical protein